MITNIDYIISTINLIICTNRMMVIDLLDQSITRAVRTTIGI